MKRKATSRRGWGTGWLIEPTKENGYKTFIAAWKFNGKIRKRSTGTTSRKEAEKVLASIVAEVKALRAHDFTEAAHRAIELEQHQVNALRKGERTLTADRLQAVIDAATQGVAEGTRRNYHTGVRRFVKWLETHRKPEGAGIELRSIGFATMVDYTAYLKSQGYTPHSMLTAFLALKGLFRRIEEAESRIVSDGSQPGSRLVAGLPWARLDTAADQWWKAPISAQRAELIDEGDSKIQPLPRQALTRDELRRLLDAECDAELHLLLRIGAQVGLRLGDACLLRFGTASMLAAGEAEVAIDEGETGRLRFTPRKTGRKSRAYIDTACGRELHDILEALPQCRTPGAYLMPELARIYRKDPSAVSRRVRRAFESAGFETGENMTGRARARCVYGYYSLRMTVARFRSTLNLEAVAAALGHSRPGTTSRSYAAGARLAEDRELEAVAWERWYRGEDTAQDARQAVSGAFHADGTETGRARVPNAQRPVYDAVCAMMGELDPATLRAIAAQAIRLATTCTAKTAKAAS